MNIHELLGSSNKWPGYLVKVLKRNKIRRLGKFGMKSGGDDGDSGGKNKQ